MAVWTTAAESGLGWERGTVLRALDANKADANDVALGQMREDEVREIAARSLAEVLFALTAPREDVAAAYHGATRPRSAG